MNSVLRRVRQFFKRIHRHETGARRRPLLEILEDRYDRRSTLVTAQAPLENWHELIGDPTLADAALDRLVHNAHRLTLSGESMRKTRGTLTKQPEKAE